MKKIASTVKKGARKKRRQKTSLETSTWVSVKKHKWFYFMLLPAVTFFFVFKYLPMFGIIVAFKDYNPFIGFFKSPWVGLRWFIEMFQKPEFLQVLRNTLVISFGMLVFGFPAPIILAILFNEVRNVPYKRVIQTVTYLPHFISWAIFGGLVFTILSPSSGIVNQIIGAMGGEKIYFLSRPEYIRTVMIFSSICKNMGWGSIIYLAVITGIDPGLYEAAIIDGAGKFRQIWSITLPSMLTIIVLNLVFTSADIFRVGFDMVYNLVTPPTYATGEVLATYIYRVGIGRYQYSFTAAVGLAQSLVGLLLLLAANKLARKYHEEGAVW
jgi:putative aldouronate transport system permease protein